MSLPTNHERNESTTDKYLDLKIPHTMTTAVDPTGSPRLGNETFFSSARTSVINNRIESVMRLNIEAPSSTSDISNFFINCQLQAN
jgi:hypothetical protein